MLMDMRSRGLRLGDTFIVEVTAEDINSGQYGNKEDCAVARAVNRATGLRWLIPHRHAAYCLDGNLGFILPRQVQDFITCWDHQTAGFGPFSFTAELTIHSGRYVYSSHVQQPLNPFMDTLALPE